MLVLFILAAVLKQTNNNQSVISRSLCSSVANNCLDSTIQDISSVESHLNESQNEKMQEPVKSVGFKERPQLMQFLCKQHKV